MKFWKINTNHSIVFLFDCWVDLRWIIRIFWFISIKISNLWMEILLNCNAIYEWILALKHLICFFKIFLISPNAFLISKILLLISRNQLFYIFFLLTFLVSFYWHLIVFFLDFLLRLFIELCIKTFYWDFLLRLFI